MSRAVIVLSDDVVSIFTIVNGRLDLVDSVPWLEFDFIARVVDVLTKKARVSSVALLYDMVEQYYRKEVVPKVGLFDQQNVIKRKLAAAFPNYPIREPLPLKNAAKKTGASQAFEKTTTGAAGLPFLFVAIPETDQLLRLAEALRQAMAVVTGIYLLPIESVSMVQELSKKLNGKNAAPDRWTIFMSQHAGGGLRQIVVRNGELALTRLTPIFDSNMEMHLWADEVVQEYNATIGYLSRFGYTPKSDTEVIVLGAQAGLEHLREKLQVPQLHAVTVRDATKLLRLKAYADEALRYADVVHAAWLNQKTKFVLPFRMRQMADFSKIRQTARAAMILLWLGFVGLAGYSAYIYSDLMTVQTNLEDEKAKLVRLTAEYDAEFQKMAGFGVDVKLVQAATKVYAEMSADQMDFVPFFQKIDTARGTDQFFDQIEMRPLIQEGGASDPMAMVSGGAKKPDMITELSISFPADMKEPNKELEGLRQRVEAALAVDSYTVTVSEQIKDNTADQEFTFTPGKEIEKKEVTERVTGKIRIQKKAATP